MDILIYQKQEKLLVRLAGRVVLDECDRLKATVASAISPEVKRVCLELSGVEFIDSAGLGALVGMKVSANKSRAVLSLLSPSKNVGEILVVSKLDSIFEIVTARDAEALVSELAREEYLLPGVEAPGAESLQTMSHKQFQSPPAGTPPPASASPRERIDQLCKTAVDFMRQRDYDRAVQCYRDVLALDPNYVPAINNLAIVYEKKPQWKQLAVEQWEKVLALGKEHGDPKHIERAQKHLADLKGS